MKCQVTKPRCPLMFRLWEPSNVIHYYRARYEG